MGIVLLAACQTQSLPQPVLDQPDFYLSGTIAGQPIYLQAGIEGYYMHTQYEQERSGVYALRGFLSPVNCLECPSSVMIELRDKEIRPENDAPANILAALTTGNYSYGNSVSGTGPEIEVAFVNETQGNGPHQYHWTFGDGTESFIENPVHRYDPNLGEVEVCLEATASDGCVSLVCNLIILDPNVCRADFSFESETPGGKTILFDGKESGVQPFSHRWDFGDGFIGTLGNPRYTYAENDRYQVTLNMIDSAGCRASMTKFVSTDPAICTHNFSYSVASFNPLDTLQLGMVRVSWRDADANLFRSDLVDQTGESYLRVREVLAYQDNEKKQLTRRLRLELDCLLSDGTQTIRLQEAEAYWGVALPR